MKKNLYIVILLLFATTALSQSGNFIHYNKMVAKLEANQLANGIWVSALHPTNAVGLVEYNGFPDYAASMSTPMIDYFLINSLIQCIAVVNGVADSQETHAWNSNQQICEHAFYSHALQKELNYSIYIPAGQPPADGCPLLMLLHGRGRNHLSVVNDSVLKLEIVKRKYIIVFPNGEDGWYIDSPTIPESRYHSMLVELLRTIRGNFPVSNSPDKSGICGWSMGGYGAMYFAAQSDQVSIVASTIGLLDYPNPELPAEDNYRNGKDVPAVFGDDPTQWLQLNCTQQADKIRRKKILIIGGNSGMDLRMNMNSHQKLVELNIEHTYIHFNGGHSWTTVQKTIPMMLDFMDMHFIVKNSH